MLQRGAAEQDLVRYRPAFCVAIGCSDNCLNFFLLSDALCVCCLADALDCTDAMVKKAAVEAAAESVSAATAATAPAAAATAADAMQVDTASTGAAAAAAGADVAPSESAPARQPRKLWVVQPPKPPQHAADATEFYREVRLRREEKKQVRLC